MTPETITFLVLGACAGGFINGMAGTGTALFALGFYLAVLPPVTSVAIVALMSVISGFQGLWVVRGALRADLWRPLRFMVPGLLGVPLGLAFLSTIDASTLRLGIGIFLIIYGGYFGFRKALPAFSRDTPVIDGGVGFIGGVLGGAASMSGALPAMWLSMRPWTKSETRAVLQSYNMVILSTSITLLYFGGSYDAVAINALLLTVPVGLVMAQVGIFVFRRLSDTGFRRLLILLTLVMGLGTIASEIL